MKSALRAFNFGGYFRGLISFGLVLILIIQLGLLWFSTMKQPTRLPDFIAAFVCNQLSKEGIQLQTRSLWIQPDLDIAADDVSIAFDGISGEMVSAKHLEVGISFIGLISGHTMPHRLSIQGGQVWCPAALSQLGQKNLVIAEIDGDFHREGRWILTPGFILRSGQTIATIEGEAPVSILDFKNNGAADLAILRTEISTCLKGLEQFVEAAKQAGGASLYIHAEGLADDGSVITVSGQLGNQKGDSDLGLLQAHELTFLGKIKLNRQSDLVNWSLTGTGSNLRYKNLQLGNLSLELIGAHEWVPTHGRFIGGNASLPELPNLQVLVDLSSQQVGDEPEHLHANYKIHSPDSFISGQIFEIPKGWNNANRLGELIGRIDYAQLSTAEIKKFPAIQSALTSAQVNCEGTIGIRDTTLYFNNGLKRYNGWISFSGVETRGLSASSLTKQRNLPLVAFIDYNQERQPYALQFRELQLATIKGEVDWALTAEAPFSIRLRGDLLPGALDQVLESWWLDLWTRLHTSGTLTAIIDVNGQLFPPRSTTCGTVHINEFDFLQAPFKSGDIQVDTNESGIQIGLRNIHGRGSDSAGTLNGRVSWTNKKLAGEGGPFVELSGNLEPWILAKCASDELGENLKNIQLPPSRTITVKAKPGAKNLEVDAEVNCTTDFTAWGIPCKDLLCKVDNKNESISIQSSLAIAEGIGALSITSEPGHDSKISVTLKDCDSNLIARGLGYTKIPVPKKGTPKDATRLNFTLNGTIDIKSPEQIRCLGSFDVANPEIKKIRILGGLSSVLEAIGIGATTYELTHLTGQFGCINGRAYFPNVLISGPQSRLNLAGEADIAAATVDFAGVFNIPQKESSIFPNPFNLNRTIADNTQITIKGPLSQPKIKATPSFFFFHKLFKINSLGKIPAELLE